MLKLSRLFAAFLFGFGAMSSAARADATLKAGDPAPALSVAKFVKGDEVKEFEKGKIYVVEFWATWCPPCRESIPHLSAMQKTYPDVTFIGSDVGEDEKTVAPFVAKMGDKMDYRVVLDKADGSNNANYMTAAGQNGIPTAFLIDKDSKIAWIGHPMELEPVLKQVVAGNFDVKKAAAASDAKNKVMALLQANDLDGAMKAADEIVTADPSQAGTMGVLEVELLLKGKKDVAAAARKADELSSKIEDAESLNELAWGLATADKTTPESLATAQKLSESSLEKSKENPMYTDTLARIYAVKKDFKKAVELETKAVAACTDDKVKPELEKNLEAYKTETVPAAAE